MINKQPPPDQGHDRSETFTQSDILKPRWVTAWEERLGKQLPGTPDLPVFLKLFIVTPLIWGLLQWPVLSGRLHHTVVFSFFLSYILLDYLAVLFTRAGRTHPAFGRLLDRISDYPLLFIITIYAFPVLPALLLGCKILIDLLILVLFFLGRGSHLNRLRNSVNYVTLLAMLLLIQGFKEITPELTIRLLTVNIVFNALAALYHLNILQKRFIADALSGANLICGILSMVFAAQGRLVFSLVFLMLGAAFDGFDGAAARKFGGTRWGVYSDDLADAINYGVAPGAALYFTLSGTEGIVSGVFYTVFTLARLVFFTLNKSAGDPEYFNGVPSTMGALITLCALILFPGYPVLTGLLVGIACVLMVSFDTHYRHLGRVLSRHHRAFFGMPLLIILLLAGGKLFGTALPVTLILLACLGYGFRPTVLHFSNVLRRRKQMDQVSKNNKNDMKGE